MRIVLVILFSVFLFGCASQTQTGNAYSSNQSRQAQIIQRGKVTATKDVDVTPQHTGVGALAGAALGSVAGSNNGRAGSNKSAASSILGMVIGGVAGSAVEKKVNTVKGQELSILLTNGSEIAIVQEIDQNEGPFRIGEEVRVLTNPTGTSRVTR